EVVSGVVAAIEGAFGAERLTRVPALCNGAPDGGVGSSYIAPRGTLKVASLQVLTLIIFAGLARIVLYQLYAVLGRRVGRKPEAQGVPTTAQPRRATDAAAGEPDDGISLTGLAAVKAKDPGFDVSRFLTGAKTAYEMIVKAFANGDRNQLRPLL